MGRSYNVRYREMKDAQFRASGNQPENIAERIIRQRIGERVSAERKLRWTPDNYNADEVLDFIENRTRELEAAEATAGTQAQLVEAFPKLNAKTLEAAREWYAAREGL